MTSGRRRGSQGSGSVSCRGMTRSISSSTPAGCCSTGGVVVPFVCGLMLIAGFSFAAFVFLPPARLFFIALSGGLIAVLVLAVREAQDAAERQYEFKADPDGLLCRSFGLRGSREERWPHTETRGTSVRRGTLVMSTKGGQVVLLRHDPDVARAVNAYLSAKLRFGARKPPGWKEVVRWMASQCRRVVVETIRATPGKASRLKHRRPKSPSGGPGRNRR